MKIHVVFDTEGYVHAAYKDKQDGMKHMSDLHDRLVNSPNFRNVGMARNHIWWDDGCDERHIILQEVELK